MVRTNGELQAALKQARDETHPSYIEVRLQQHWMPTPQSQLDHARVYQEFDLSQVAAVELTTYNTEPVAER